MVWKPIATQADAQALLEQVGGFHDGCLREAHVWTGHWVADDLSMAVDPTTCVRLLIQRQFRPLSAIELLFEHVTRFNLVPAPEHYENIIREAALFVRGGIVYWADSGHWQPDHPARDDQTWIAARAAKWRDASEWLGESLRYGPASLRREGGDAAPKKGAV